LLLIVAAHGMFEEDFEHVQTFFAMEDDHEDIEFKDINDYVALGCDIDHRTNDGLTLFKIALAAGNFFLAKHLLNISKKPLEETYGLILKSSLLIYYADRRALGFCLALFWLKNMLQSMNK
jgi:hypothetical protein